MWFKYCFQQVIEKLSRLIKIILKNLNFNNTRPSVSYRITQQQIICQVCTFFERVKNNKNNVTSDVNNKFEKDILHMSSVQ